MTPLLKLLPSLPFRQRNRQSPTGPRRSSLVLFNLTFCYSVPFSASAGRLFLKCARCILILGLLPWLLPVFGMFFLPHIWVKWLTFCYLTNSQPWPPLYTYNILPFNWFLSFTLRLLPPSNILDILHDLLTVHVSLFLPPKPHKIIMLNKYLNQWILYIALHPYKSVLFF